MSLIPNEERFVQLLTLGKRVSEAKPTYVKNITNEDLKEIYWIILTELAEETWSHTKMLERAKEKLTNHSEEDIELIVSTELTRIINYNKEIVYTAMSGEDTRYGWMGPLDCYTTPMCRYLQTGSLQPADIEQLKKLGHTPDELPEIPEEGMTMAEMKHACRKLASLFGYKMDTDLLMHPGCRHTFAVGNRRLDPVLQNKVPLKKFIQEFKL